MSEGVYIPDKKYIPKPGPVPSHIKSVPNWASDESKDDVVRKAARDIGQYFADFDGQDARDKMITNMDTADEMSRAAITASQLQADANVNGEKLEDTHTNVTSTSFYRYLRAVTAWETNVMFGNEQELPVKAEPIPGTQGAKEDDALSQADIRNQTLAYAFEHGGMREVLSDNQFFLNKYGNAVLGMGWCREEEEITERVPIRNPLKLMARKLTGGKTWEWKTSNKVIKDTPVVRRIDMRNVWYDMTIDDLQKQSCVIVRDQMQYGDLLELQEAGLFCNMEKVTIQHQTNMDDSGSTQAGQVLSDRRTNADEAGTDTAVTKLWDTWMSYARLPIDDDGKWDEKRVIPRWVECWFVGDIEQAESAVCVRLAPLPYNKKQIPLKLVHSIRDDKGAAHVGYAELAKCLIAIEMTIFNQGIDNWKQRNRVPLLAEKSSILAKELMFTKGGNRIVWYKAGSKEPKEMQIGDTTATMPIMLQETDRRLQDVFGVNKPFMSQALGGRTSAQEALFVTDQAIKIALEDAKYKANQILTFVAEWSLDLMDQFADPDIRRFVLWGKEPVEVKPQDAWMPINIRITAIKQFQDSAIRRREEDQFINQIFPLIRPIMSVKGQIAFFTQVAKNRGFDNVDEWWSQASDYDAREEAKKENVDILWYGIDDLPAREENHAAHLSEHKPTLASYVLLPQEQQNPENIRRMKLHIQMHERFESEGQAAAAIPQTMGGMGAQAPASGMAGQEGGEAIAAGMGMFGNMPSPQPEAEA